MFRTETTVEMLKPIATIVGLAIILWSLGLPSLRFVEAANVSNFSDTLSDSAPSAESNHTIEYTTTAGIAAAGVITLDFTGFNVSGVDYTDIDLVINGVEQTLDATASGATWGAAFTGNILEIESGTATSGPGVVIEIEIGLNATAGVAGNAQINNPAAEASYAIALTSGATDTGETRVVVLSAVEVTATVNTIFTFEVSGVNAGGTVNGEAITGSTGSTSIPFGVLDDTSATTSAQLLTVGTNAANGYVVTVETDTPFWSTTGAVIDGFQNGSNTNTPTTWTSPTGIIGSANTWGHWGITSDDNDIDSRGADQFDASEFIAASTTPREIMQHDGPVNGAGVSVGTTTIGYKVEISALQEAADDYSTTLTYIATPTF